jgi:hypothetical protein
LGWGSWADIEDDDDDAFTIDGHKIEIICSSKAHDIRGIILPKSDNMRGLSDLYELHEKLYSSKRGSFMGFMKTTCESCN